MLLSGLSLWFTLATEGERDTAHPSVSACTPSLLVHTWKFVKLDRTEEATEDQKKKRSVPSVSVSVEHPHVLPSRFLWFTLERKDSSISVFMVHPKINVRILPSPLSWFTLERKDSSVSVFMVHTKINVRILPSPFPWFTLERKDSSVSVQK